MTTSIISTQENIVKWITPIDPTTDLTDIPDGVYPFNYIGEDKWAVVIGGAVVNWSCTYGAACLMHIDAMRVKREHVQRNPANALGSWWTVRTADFTASVDRETGKVSYEDHS